VSSCSDFLTRHEGPPRAGVDDAENESAPASMACVEIDAAHLVLQCRPVESAAAILQVLNV
jgi:hypothetical protein